MENVIGDFVLDAMSTASASKVLALLTFPGDLGKARLGSPASLWKDPAMLQLSHKGFSRAAFFHKDLAGKRPLKPTGLLTNTDTVLEIEALVQGWPSFDGNGRYSGPLPNKSGEGAGFNREEETAARDSPAVAMKLVAGLFHGWVRRQWAACGGTPQDGVTATGAGQSSESTPPRSPGESPVKAPALPRGVGPQGASPVDHIDPESRGEPVDRQTSSPERSVPPGAGPGLAAAGPEVAVQQGVEWWSQSQSSSGWWDRLVSRLPEVRASVSNGAQVVQLGWKGKEEKGLVSDTLADGLPFFPLVNTVIREYLKHSGEYFNWTSVWISFRPSEAWNNGRAWPGRALAFSVGGGGSTSLHLQDRLGSVKVLALDSPVFFDPFWPFLFVQPPGGGSCGGGVSRRRSGRTDEASHRETQGLGVFTGGPQGVDSTSQGSGSGGRPGW